MLHIVEYIKSLYPGKDFIPLHEPVFQGNEKKYLNETIDSTFVSSVGQFVDRVEKEFAEFVGSKYAIATVNGSSALHVSLILAEVEQYDEVITQALTFVATANAVSYIGASPIFIDVDKETMGLSPEALERFLDQNAELKKGVCFNKKTGKKIKACVPMHTFGLPCKLDRIAEICAKWKIVLVEDAAESLGSYYKGKHTGTYGRLGTFSFNGNKVITSGGGGMIVTNDEQLALRAKHLTTTAKVPHGWEYIHDEVGFNYRMPNLNAALLLAQLEMLPSILKNKRELASLYRSFFKQESVLFVSESESTISNYWLNGLIFHDKAERDHFLEISNANGVMTRPVWRLMNKLKMYDSAQCDNLENSIWLEERVVNIPSGVRG